MQPSDGLSRPCRALEQKWSFSVGPCWAKRGWAFMSTLIIGPGSPWDVALDEVTLPGTPLIPQPQAVTVRGNCPPGSSSEAQCPELLLGSSCGPLCLTCIRIPGSPGERRCCTETTVIAQAV